MKKLFIAIVGLSIFSSYCAETQILSENKYDVTYGVSGKILYVKAPDGHEYIISSVGSKEKNNACGGTSIIHAEGCKKCEEIKSNHEIKIIQEDFGRYVIKAEKKRTVKEICK